jgi:HlyD family secretion protein
MPSRASLILGCILSAACIGAYGLWRSTPPQPIAGVVRTTEIRIAPEVGGQLVAIKLTKGDNVQTGDIVAELSAIELAAAVAQARAALDAVTANRNNV